ncbi:MAG: HAMP domain-containing sensor histidine kinase [Chloroflexota bacterium]
MKESHFLYIFFIGLLGFSFFTLGLVALPSQSDLFNLFILVCLAAIAEIAAPFLTVGKTKVAYEVGTAVSLATVPVYGPAIGAFVISISGLCYWLHKYYNVPPSKRRWDQLVFNIGMRSVAIYIAGSFLWLSYSFNPALNTFMLVLAWLGAAIILDQLNLWLLIGLLRLLKGPAIKPFDFWLSNRWAMLTNIAVEAIGGFTLATALFLHGTLGVIVFFLPIGLSAISFQLYVRQMKAHMDNLENIIEERTKELADLMGEKDALLSVLAHDMKTPITSINLYGSLLRDKPELAAKKPHMLDVILRSQTTLINIVNNILDIEKLSSNRELITNPETFDFVELLSATVESLQAHAQQKAIKLNYLLPPGPLSIHADRVQIERVLQNVLSNAIKYTPEKGNVDVRLQSNEGYLHLDIIDTGYGIPESELPYIFDRYRRVIKHKDKASGTGLGLAITKALVESHNGEIRVDSVEEQGTTFTITLPVVMKSPQAK